MIRNLKIFLGTYKIVNVAFNPSITKDFGIDSNLHRERSMLINLAIDFLQDSHKCSILRDYTILKKPKLYKGSMTRALTTLTKRARQNDTVVEKQVDELENMFGKLHNSDKLSMMNKLGHIVDESAEEEQFDVDDEVNETEVDEDSSSGISQTLNIVNGADAPNTRKPLDIKLPGAATKQAGANLIEEVCNDEGPSQVEPTHSVTTFAQDDKSVICLKVELPGVKSVAECELDISKVSLSFC